MCAIFGIIGENNFDLIKRMSKVQEYRGPDSQNFYFDEKNLINLGNNRLSIIDIEKGIQPMKSYNEECIIVFNGTIFNHKEIKKFLIQKGLKFKTNSDTEVFVNGYSFWNDKMFNYIDGMWAVAIYDLKKKEIILSRDYLGQKPLFYEIQKNKILFSSQLLGIIQDKKIEREINYDGIKKFHFSSFLQAPHSIYKSIKQLQPGEIVKINIKNLEVKKKIFWDLNKGPDHNQFFQDNEESFSLKFEEIIRNYSISDIEPAGLLSSGLDSFLVNKYLTNNNPRFKTFTLSFKNKSFDESKNFNKEFDIFNKNISTLDEDKIFKNTKCILKNLDHLCGDSSIVPTFTLIKDIKKHSKVLLSGDGGDEAFMGYIIFKALYGAKKLKFFPSFFLNFLKNLTSYLPINYSYLSTSFRIKKFFLNINSEVNNLTPLWMSPLKVDDYNILFEENFSEETLCRDFNKLSPHYLKNAQLYFYNFYLPYSVLFKTDFASMLNSVEYRSPLLSKNVINLSLEQNTKKIFSFIKQKKFMIDLFQNQIPSSVRKIPKHGIAFPKNSVISKNFIDEILIEKYLMNKKFFFKKLENYINQKEDCSQYLWNEIVYTNVINNVENKKI